MFKANPQGGSAIIEIEIAIEIAKLPEIYVTSQKLVASMTWMPAFAGMTSLRERAVSVIPAQAGIQGQMQFQGLPGLFEQLQIDFDSDFDFDTDPERPWFENKSAPCALGDRWIAFLRVSSVKAAFHVRNRNSPLKPTSRRQQAWPWIILVRRAWASERPSPPRR